ncbi:MAG: nucleotidyl transferase AbiEii/AbiGii toxin family protein [Planctomycetota bacterium]
MEILRILTHRGRERGISFILIGGHALNVYGVARQTGDVDIVVRAEDRNEWRAILTSLGYKLYHDHPSFMQFMAPSIDTWPVDLILVDGPTFTGLHHDGREVELGAARVIVPSVEHLLALKLHVLKQQQPERELRDLEDILGLIERARVDVSRPAFLHLCEKYGTREIHDRIVELMRKRRAP